MEIIKGKRLLIPDEDSPIDNLQTLSLAAGIKVPIWNSGTQSVIKNFSLDDWSSSELQKLFTNKKLFHTKPHLGIII